MFGQNLLTFSLIICYNLEFFQQRILSILTTKLLSILYSLRVNTNTFFSNLAESSPVALEVHQLAFGQLLAHCGDLFRQQGQQFTVCCFNNPFELLTHCGDLFRHLVQQFPAYCFDDQDNRIAMRMTSSICLEKVWRRVMLNWPFERSRLFIVRWACSTTIMKQGISLS